MPDYRRLFISGGTYFFTVVTYQRKSIFSNELASTIFRSVWQKVFHEHPFTTLAFCLLPDHLHCVITLPEDDSSYPIRIREIKRQFTISYKPNEIDNKKNLSRQKQSESTIWQRRYWEHTIRNEKNLEHHVNYIHYNPVKYGYVQKVADWQWSSFHRFVRMGLCDKGW